MEVEAEAEVEAEVEAEAEAEAEAEVAAEAGRRATELLRRRWFGTFRLPGGRSGTYRGGFGERVVCTRAVSAHVMRQQEVEEPERRDSGSLLSPRERFACLVGVFAAFSGGVSPNYARLVGGFAAH